MDEIDEPGSMEAALAEIRRLKSDLADAQTAVGLWLAAAEYACDRPAPDCGCGPCRKFRAAMQPHEPTEEAHV